MSDPMTNTEVEDVLASIRRLVSDDKRPETAPEPEAPSDRLVLTPSLRVMEEPEPETVEEPEPETAEEVEVEAQDTDVEEHEKQGSADVDQAIDMSIQEAFAEDEAAFDDETAEEPAAEHEHAEDDAAQNADESSFDAEYEEAEFTDPSDASLDGVEDQADDEHAQIADVVEEPDVSFDDGSEDNDQGFEVEADSEADEPQQSLSEKIAALETLVAGRSEQFEPDDAGTDAYAGTEPPAMAWEDAEDDAHADATPDDAGEDTAAYSAFVASAAAAAEVDDADTQIFAGDEDVLDEDALRELVSDIVREELQGALGERITRNVRKLVRREIHRALAAQELD